MDKGKDTIEPKRSDIGIRGACPCLASVRMSHDCVKWGPISGIWAWLARRLHGRWPDGSRKSIAARPDALRRMPRYLT